MQYQQKNQSKNLNLQK